MNLENTAQSLIDVVKHVQSEINIIKQTTTGKTQVMAVPVGWEGIDSETLLGVKVTYQTENGRFVERLFWSEIVVPTNSYEQLAMLLQETMQEILGGQKLS